MPVCFRDIPAAAHCRPGFRVPGRFPRGRHSDAGLLSEHFCGGHCRQSFGVRSCKNSRNPFLSCVAGKTAGGFSISRPFSFENTAFVLYVSMRLLFHCFPQNFRCLPRRNQNTKRPHDLKRPCGRFFAAF